MSERTRLTPVPICGRVIDWKGQYGWIEPSCVVDHPDNKKHQGHIFAHSEDVMPKWKNLTPGSLVEFHLYYDGQGLGAQECVARKVLRLTVPWEASQKMFGSEGEQLPEFEKKYQVTMRAYQWMLIDGSPSDLPFLLCEIWGRPQNIIRAVLEVTAEEGGVIAAKMLVPESRLWKLNLQQLTQRCPQTELSSGVIITDPMRCHSLTFSGGREQAGLALQALIVQVCD